MSHLLSFAIEGLTGRKEPVAFELNRDINVIFGFNGSGKTSLLKILHSAMSGDTQILNNISFTGAEVSIQSITDNQSYTHVAERVDETKHKLRFPQRYRESMDEKEYFFVMQQMQAVESKWQWITKPVKRDRGVTKWAHTYLPTSRVYLSAKVQRTSGDERFISEEQFERFYAVALQDLWASYYDEIIKIVSKAQEDGLANILKSILSPNSIPAKNARIIDPATAYRSASAFLKRQGSPNIIGKQANFEKSYDKNPQLRNVVSDINEVEQKIETAMAPRNRLQSLITKMFSGNKTLTFDEKRVTVTSFENEPISLSLLSSGEKHLLRIFIDALSANENSAIIDEPELSLHIDWQRDLIEGMQELNPKAQYIMATHSPEIMANIDDSKIFRI